MRRLFLALAPLVLLAFGSTASAQQMGGAAGGMAERRQEALFRDITLTPAQKAGVDSINAAYRGKMSEMGRPQPGDTAAMQARRNLVRQQEADLRALLTEEQRATYDRNVEAMRAIMQQREGNRPR